MNYRIHVVLVVLMVSGCGWGDFDRREKYLEAETIDRVEVPESLDQPRYDDLLVIPEVADVREIAGQVFEIGLPEPLSTTFGVDQIVIKRLGDSRWVFVDTPPATVWPRIRQFWEDNRLNLEMVDPSRGVMESRWFVARGNTPEDIFTSMSSGTAWADQAASLRHKFRIKVEPGIRSGSTEIYLEQKSLPLGSPVRPDSIEWTGVSDDSELEGLMLSRLAYYLGDKINESTSVSRLAANIGGEKAELVPDRTRPVLKYKLPFNRAWATVGDALENARVDVEDLNRDEATYYVYYVDQAGDSGGFFGRLFSDRDRDGQKVEAGDENRYQVQLNDKGDEVHVIVMKDAGNLADALIAEKLLKIIKQFST